MLFNHITTWQKDHISFENQYDAIWAESNYWRNKQSSTSQIKESSDQLFQAIQKILETLGQSLDLSPLSGEIQKSKYYSELLKEYIFEDVRTNEFPEKP